jgi:hypothetical protein
MVNTYSLTALVNEGEGIFDGFREGQPGFTATDFLAPVPGTFHVEAESAEAALEVMWAVGNRQGPDSYGRQWPSTVRSMSVGDVLVVKGHGVWKCARMGWEPTDEAAVLRGLFFGDRRLDLPRGWVADERPTSTEPLVKRDDVLSIVEVESWEEDPSMACYRIKESVESLPTY